MIDRMTKSPVDCSWSKEEVETLRALLDEQRGWWDEVAKRSCVSTRYIRAFVGREVDMPTADRFLLLQATVRALVEREAKREAKANAFGRTWTPKRRKAKA